MATYHTTVRHINAKKSSSPIRHLWRHTLYYGRTPLATWVVTDIQYGMSAAWMHKLGDSFNRIEVIIEANKNQHRVTDLASTNPDTTTKPIKSAQSGAREDNQ